jgi:hypothetical protein
MLRALLRPPLRSLGAAPALAGGWSSGPADARGAAPNAPGALARTVSSVPAPPLQWGALGLTPEQLDFQGAHACQGCAGRVLAPACGREDRRRRPARKSLNHRRRPGRADPPAPPPSARALPRPQPWRRPSRGSTSRPTRPAGTRPRSSRWTRCGRRRRSDSGASTRQRNWAAPASAGQVRGTAPAGSKPGRGGVTRQLRRRWRRLRACWTA